MSKITSQMIAQVVAEKLDQVDSARPLARQLAAYLASTRQVSKAADVVRATEAERLRRGIVEARITTARRLESSLRDDVQRFIRHLVPGVQKLILHETIQPDCIGGIKIQVAGLELDTTVQARLQQLVRRYHKGQ